MGKKEEAETKTQKINGKTRNDTHRVWSRIYSANSKEKMRKKSTQNGKSAKEEQKERAQNITKMARLSYN